MLGNAIFIDQKSGAAREWDKAGDLDIAISKALHHAARRHPGAKPYEAMDLFRKDTNASRIDSMRAQDFGSFARRGDATGGAEVSRGLEYRYGEVMREEFPIPNGLELFETDTSVPPGALTYTIRRQMASGEEADYKAGTNIPRGGISVGDETRPIRNYVTGWGNTIFEQQSSEFAGLNEDRELFRTARDVMMQFLNRRIWYGSAEFDVWGVLNYPWLNVAVSTVVMGGPSTSTAAAIIGELGRLANSARDASNGLFEPNSLALSNRLYTYMATTPYGSVNDTTILEYFLRTNDHIKKVTKVWELTNAGPGGAQGALFYRGDRYGIRNVIPQNFTVLPQQAIAFDRNNYAYMSHGGIRMDYVGDSLLVWFNVP